MSLRLGLKPFRDLRGAVFGVSTGEPLVFAS